MSDAREGCLSLLERRDEDMPATTWGKVLTSWFKSLEAEVRSGFAPDLAERVAHKLAGWQQLRTLEGSSPTPWFEIVAELFEAARGAPTEASLDAVVRWCQAPPGGTGTASAAGGRADRVMAYRMLFAARRPGNQQWLRQGVVPIAFLVNGVGVPARLELDVVLPPASIPTRPVALLAPFENLASLAGLHRNPEAQETLEEVDIDAFRQSMCVAHRCGVSEGAGPRPSMFYRTVPIGDAVPPLGVDGASASLAAWLAFVRIRESFARAHKPAIDPRILALGALQDVDGRVHLLPVGGVTAKLEAWANGHQDEIDTILVAGEQEREEAAKLVERRRLPWQVVLAA